jgi:hypothetical protein
MWNFGLAGAGTPGSVCPEIDVGLDSNIELTQRVRANRGEKSLTQGRRLVVQQWHSQSKKALQETKLLELC